MIPGWRRWVGRHSRCGDVDVKQPRGRASALTAAIVLAALAAGAAGGEVVINGRALYPEGPLVVADGVDYAEMGGDRVMHYDGNANKVMWSRVGCGPTQVARYGDGLVVLCHIEAALALISRDGATRKIIDRDRNGRSFLTPNAATDDGKGGVYLSSSGIFAAHAPLIGAVLYLDRRGTLSRLAEGIHYANGVALSADGRTLYVSEHLSRRVLAFDVHKDGTLSDRRVYVALDDLEAPDPGRGWEVGPDGLAVDRGGDLYIAEYGAGHLLVVGRDRQLKATVTVAQPYVTAVALTGDERSLYITAAASLYNPKEAGAVYLVANPVAGD